VKAILLFTLAMLISAAAFHSESELDYSKRKSAEVEQVIVPSIHERYLELVNSPASTDALLFAKGSIFRKDGNLIWETLSSEQVVLVDGSQLDEGFGISEFIVSPDGEKVAYATTFRGQDLKYWNVVTIEVRPRELLDRPVLNRMLGFTWAKNSDGLYYSFWNDKEAVERGEKSIIEYRFRNIQSGKDQVVFDPGLAENFAIADIDGGTTLVAYRVHAEVAGIKTTFSMYQGVRDPDGGYRWSAIYPRNQYVAKFLGYEDGKVYLLTEEAGDTYGVVEVDIQNGAERRVVVPALETSVLHIAHYHQRNLILQYHSVPEQNVSLRTVNLDSGDGGIFQISDLGLTPFGALGDFQLAPGGMVARAVYSDVMTGNHTIELNLDEHSLVKLPNRSELNFDSSKVQQELFSFTADDGTAITGRLYTRKDRPPSFVFMRYYGWISIKNSPEPREIQLALELGGAYMTLDLPGGGEAVSLGLFVDHETGMK